MRLLDFIRLLVRSAAVIGIVAAAGASGGFLVSRAEAPQYQSTALLMVTAVPQFSAAEGQSANALAQSRAQLLVQLAQSDRVLNSVRSDLAIPRSLETLRRAVSANAVDESNFTSVSVSAATPEQAEDGATVLTTVLRAEGEAIDSNLVDGEIDADMHIEVVSAAEQPRIAFAPQPRNYVIAGGAAGLALAVGFFLLRDLVSQRVWGPDDARTLVPEASIAVLRRTRSRSRSGPDWKSEEVRFLRNDIVGMFGPGKQLVLVDVGRWSRAAHLGPQLVGTLRDLGLPARMLAADSSGGSDSSASEGRGQTSVPQMIERGPAEDSLRPSAQPLQSGPSSGRAALQGYDLLHFESLLDASDFLATGSRDATVVLHLRAGLSRYPAALSAVEHLTTVRMRPTIVVVSGVRAIDRSPTIARATDRRGT